MKTRRLLSLPALLLLVLVLLNGAPSNPTAQASQGHAFADPAFKRVWDRTDSLVASGAVKRSWYWGPQPNTGQVLEEYAEGPGGQHLVQYFDKSRMEINNPSADPNNPFYVTNGLLTKELVSGYVQTGNNKFAFRYPSRIPVAGEPSSSAVTYAALGYVVEQPARDSTGKVVSERLTYDGYPGSIPAQIDVRDPTGYAVKYAYFERATSHNIPDVFWTFLNTNGPVIENGQQTTAQLSVPYFYVTGYPISEAYWTAATIEGKSTPAMIQAYERRVLTYVPDAPEGFKVQMGNVGQHYYDWRYKGAGKPEALANACTSKPPVRGFGKVYNENEAVKIRLNCLIEQERFASVSRQFFQHGQMLSITVRDPLWLADREEVYALFEDGRVRSFGWVDPEVIPEPPSGIPAGLHAPTGSFLTVWAENNLSQSLGWATGPADVQKNTPGTQTGGVVAEFQGGLMVYPNLAAKQIYVLYSSSSTSWLPVYERQGGRHFHADYWLVFDDTFTGN